MNSQPASWSLLSMDARLGRTALACLAALFSLPAPLCLQAQTKSAPKPPIPTVEAGLEEAVKWRWRVEPSERAKWGIPVALETPATTTAAGTTAGSTSQAAPVTPPRPSGPPEHPLEHEVVRGDSLYVIARRYGVGIDHLKKANEMTSDLIRIGQILKVPSREQIAAMMPPPPPPEEKKDGEAKPTVSVKPPAAETRPAVVIPKYSRPLNAEAQRSSHVVLTQSFLSRKLFSCGPIDGADGSMYQSAIAAYRAAYPGELDYSGGQTPEVLRALGGAYREYVLRSEDYRWIAPETATALSRYQSRGQPARDPDPDFNTLTRGDFLPYRSAWEFVAERFHCSESFLRRLNSAIKSTPKPGVLFLVPNVEPFEIENVFDDPIQPEIPPDEPVFAKIVNNAWFEVWQGDQLKARVPVSAARPGLRGRGTWKILKAIPHPQLVCTGEWSSPPKAAEIGLSNQEVILKPPPLNVIIPPGPNNPVGPLWIDLAKSGETEPLPYGLHGTSIPGYMTRQESLGGFRLANWDLARIVRLLPAGTDLKWE